MKLHVGMDKIEKLRQVPADLVEKAKAVPDETAVIVRKYPAESVCTAMAVGFLAGVIVGFLFAPVKKGVNLFSNNDLHTEEGGAAPEKRCCGKREDDPDEDDEEEVLAL